MTKTGFNRGQEDLTIASLYRLLKLNPDDLCKFLYPQIYPVHVRKDDRIFQSNGKYVRIGEEVYNGGGDVMLPSTVRASMERIELEGIYLIDTAEYIYLYVLKQADPELIL